MLTQLIKIFK